MIKKDMKFNFYFDNTDILEDILAEVIINNIKDKYKIFEEIYE